MELANIQLALNGKTVKQVYIDTSGGHEALVILTGDGNKVELRGLAANCMFARATYTQTTEGQITGGSSNNA